MITDTQFWTLGTGFTVLVLAQVTLKDQAVRVQRVRLFTSLCAAASILCIGAAWLLEQPLMLEVLARGAAVAVAVGLALGATWLMRARLRPRGFQKRVNLRRGWAPASEVQRRRNGYKRVTK